MSVSRLVAIAAIFVLSCLGWGLLTASIVARSGEFDDRLRREVADLWGGEHRQLAPTAWVERSRDVEERIADAAEPGGFREVTKAVTECIRVPLSSSRVQVDLHLTHRQKGLLWYDTYAVGFEAVYRVQNPDPERRMVQVALAFPSRQGIYDGFVFRVNGQAAAPVTDLGTGLRARVPIGAGDEAVVEVQYESRGLGQWSYAFAEEGVAEVGDFQLSMTTDFRDVDFPAGTISPTAKKETTGGWLLSWQFDRLVTGQRIGMDLPNKQNPGPLAARITAFAPVSLLFFLAVMVILGVLQGRNLHPVNYAFLSAAFFAFHLLLAYLVDHVGVLAAFAAAAAVSVFLVVSYLRLVAGARFAFVRAGLAQLVFLVLFSYAFFFEGYTGLTVTIGAIVTLFVMMQATAGVDWGQVFARRTGAPGSHGAAADSASADAAGSRG